MEYREIKSIIVVGNCGWCGYKITQAEQRGDVYECPECEHEHEINDQGNLIPLPDYSWIANGYDDDGYDDDDGFEDAEVVEG